jgi:hypothetical protein
MWYNASLILKQIIGPLKTMIQTSFIGVKPLINFFKVFY